MLPLGIPVSIIINYIVSKFTKQPIIDICDILSDGIMVFISIVLCPIKNDPHLSFIVSEV